MIAPSKWDSLKTRMNELGLLEADLEERFIRGGGSGGQKINKTSSCVQLLHRPSGLEIRCQKTRSQADNRYFARRELCDQYEERIQGDASKKRQQIEKIRRQKRRRSRRAKQKMLQEKKQTAEKKVLRQKPELD